MGNSKTDFVLQNLLPRFEDLKIDAVAEVRRMLDYLHFDYKNEELEKRLNSDYDKFHRFVINYLVLLKYT